MGSIIVIIIAVLSLIVSVKKQQEQKKAKKPVQDTQYAEDRSSYKQSAANRSNSSSSNGSYSSYKRSGSSESSMKNRANSASASTAASSFATQKAAERAKDNMTEQELKTRPTAQEFKEMAGVEVGDGAILSAAKMHSFATELGNEFDSKEDLIGPVFDLMVVGPDTSIPNERDFISEGMDMINSYNC